MKLLPMFIQHIKGETEQDKQNYKHFKGYYDSIYGH